MPPRLKVIKRPVKVVPLHTETEQTEPEHDVACPKTDDAPVVVVKRIVKRKKKVVVEVDVPVIVPPVPPVPVPVPVQEKTLATYLASLTEHEQTAMEIARDHLGPSFCLERSGGFVSYLHQ